MIPGLDASLLLPAAVLIGALGVVVLASGILALRRAKPLRFTLRALTGLLILAVGALVAALGAGLQGYRALTREEIAARIDVRPVGPQRFEATVRIADRPETTYVIAGDQIYVDAHVLKWKPFANVLGLHTAYELSRIAGRYEDIEQERSAERTVHSLAPERVVDLFALRRKHEMLAPLMDAEYGSGTFVAVKRRTMLEVRVSTTGLLIREASLPSATAARAQTRR
jgi:hypothetical protein